MVANVAADLVARRKLANAARAAVAVKATLASTYPSSLEFALGVLRLDSRWVSWQGISFSDY